MRTGHCPAREILGGLSMPPRSKILALPAEVKAWLDTSLVEGNFSGYELICAELKARGYDISKSAVHRYGSEFEERLAAMKTSTEQARAVVAAAPDNEGAVNEALMRLVQDHLFKLLMAEEGKLDLPKVARAIADLGRATVSQKKMQAELRAEARAELLREQAKELEKTVQAGGMDAEQADFWRKKFLGVA